MAYSLQDILDMLAQGGGSSGGGTGGGGSVASVPSSGSATAGGASPDMISGIISNFSSGDPWRILGGQFGGILEGLFGGQGVPREAKSASIGTALSGSGNPLEELLGQFVTRGVGQGNVFSQGGSQTFGNAVERIAGMLAALTGQTLPSVTGTGNFQHDPSLAFTAVGGPFGANTFKLPAGYEFVSDPSKYSQLFKDVSGAVGEQAPATTKGAQSEWQSVLQQLISQGILQKYAGPLGPVTGGSGVTGGAGGSPNIALPHPLNTNPSKFPGAPYQPGA